MSKPSPPSKAQSKDRVETSPKSPPIRRVPEVGTQSAKSTTHVLRVVQAQSKTRAEAAVRPQPKQLPDRTKQRVTIQSAARIEATNRSLRAQPRTQTAHPIALLPVPASRLRPAQSAAPIRPITRTTSGIESATRSRLNQPTAYVKPERRPIPVRITSRFQPNQLRGTTQSTTVANLSIHSRLSSLSSSTGLIQQTVLAESLRLPALPIITNQPPIGSKITLPQATYQPPLEWQEAINQATRSSANVTENPVGIQYGHQVAPPKRPLDSALIPESSRQLASFAAIGSAGGTEKLKPITTTELQNRAPENLANGMPSSHGVTPTIPPLNSAVPFPPFRKIPLDAQHATLTIPIPPPSITQSDAQCPVPAIPLHPPTRTPSDAQRPVLALPLPPIPTAPSGPPPSALPMPVPSSNEVSLTSGPPVPELPLRPIDPVAVSLVAAGLQTSGTPAPSDPGSAVTASTSSGNQLPPFGIIPTDYDPLDLNEMTTENR